MNLKLRLILSISLAATAIVAGFAGISLSQRYREEQRRFEEKISLTQRCPPVL